MLSAFILVFPPILSLPSTVYAGTVKVDLNGDGVFNLLDIIMLKLMILSVIPPTGNADLNGDGKINDSDLQAAVNLFLGEAPSHSSGGGGSGPIPTPTSTATPTVTPTPMYTVTFNSNGGSGSMTPQSANVSTALTTNTFTRTSYNFSGWNTLANGTGTPYANGATYPFSASTTLYAQWTGSTTYILTMSPNPAAGGTASDLTGGSHASGASVSIQATAGSGYKFISWTAAAGTFGSASAATTTFTMPAQAVTVYANFVAGPTCASQLINTSGSGSFTVPSEVTSLYAEAWGAGGSGGGETTSNGRGGGGGGGAYANKSFASPTPGSAISYYVAPQTAVGTGAGAAGAYTWFSSNNSSGLVAAGGSGGATLAAGAGGAGGIAAASYGDVKYSGGAGGTANATWSGGGGGGAGSSGAGKAATSATAGDATADYGGAGGAGRNAAAAGNPGSVYGGGGGGAWRGTSTNRNGGAGAQGCIRVTYCGMIGTYYNLTVSSTAGGSVITPGEGTFAYAPGMVVNMVAVPNTSYQFVFWSDGNTSASHTYTMTSNTTLKAYFVPQGATYYVLHYIAGGGNGSISGDAYQAVVSGESGSAVTAVPNAGYGFKKWSDNVMTASRTDTPVTADKTVTANFGFQEWVYQVVYGTETTYSKLTWLLQETLASGTGNQQTIGGLCNKYETNAYSDAACTTTTQPARVNGGSPLKLESPGHDWRRNDTRQIVYRESGILAFGVLEVTSQLYDRLFDPGTWGAPYALNETWTFTHQITTSAHLGEETLPWAVSVSGITTAVNVPAGTFTCYTITATKNGDVTNQIVEYWDASGVFPWAPIKIVDTNNFDVTETRSLYNASCIP